MSRHWARRIPAPGLSSSIAAWLPCLSPNCRLDFAPAPAGAIGRRNRQPAHSLTRVGVSAQAHRAGFGPFILVILSALVQSRPAGLQPCPRTRREIPCRSHPCAQSGPPAAIQARFSSRVMASPPLPEKALDLGNIASAGNIFHRFVIDADYGRALDGLAIGARQFEFHLGFFAWLVLRRGGQNLHVHHPAFRRHHDLAHFIAQLSLRDRHRLNEEVRHVLFHDGNVFHRAFPLQPNYLGRQINRH